MQFVAWTVERYNFAHAPHDHEADFFAHGHRLRATRLTGLTRPSRLGSRQRTGPAEMSSYSLRCRVCEEVTVAEPLDACRRCDGPTDMLSYWARIERRRTPYPRGPRA